MQAHKLGIGFVLVNKLSFGFSSLCTSIALNCLGIQLGNQLFIWRFVFTFLLKEDLRMGPGLLAHSYGAKPNITCRNIPEQMAKYVYAI